MRGIHAFSRMAQAPPSHHTSKYIVQYHAPNLDSLCSATLAVVAFHLQIPPPPPGNIGLYKYYSIVHRQWNGFIP